MADQSEVMIHHIIDSIQTSIDIADQTSRKKYNFALAQMEIKMTLNFELKKDDSKTTSQGKSAKPRHWFSLFSRHKDPVLNATKSDGSDDHASMTLNMLFKPGGKTFEAMTSSSSTSATPVSSSDNSADTDAAQSSDSADTSGDDSY